MPTSFPEMKASASASWPCGSPKPCPVKPRLPRPTGFLRPQRAEHLAARAAGVAQIDQPVALAEPRERLPSFLASLVRPDLLRERADRALQGVIQLRRRPDGAPEGVGEGGGLRERPALAGRPRPCRRASSADKPAQVARRRRLQPQHEVRQEPVERVPDTVSASCPTGPDTGPPAACSCRWRLPSSPAPRLGPVSMAPADRRTGDDRSAKPVPAGRVESHPPKRPPSSGQERSPGDRGMIEI